MKKILLIATGGTIAGRGAEGKSGNYHSGELTVEDLLASVPKIREVAELSWVQAANLNSDDITAEHWIRLARLIEELAEDDGTAGFVITHGTDTLEETAYFLHLVLKTEKPVVITGSMRPATALSADGPKNLYASVVLAKSEAAAGRGVLVVFEDRIYDARGVQKVSTFALEAFSSRDLGCLGYMLDEQPYFYQKSIRLHTRETAFSVSGLSGLPRVEILYFSVEASPELLLYAAEISDGIVLAGAGNGNYSLKWNEAVRSLQTRGIPVVRCSRIGSGEITPDDLFDGFSHVITGGNLSPQKAKILLQLSLTVTGDIAEIRRMFGVY